ncbi:MAG TPA: metalloregulator ArsR/SmtB family transcription factor [Opitutaceae bacterium]|nr:metalloregulator ArsR/SmtB family transcription factor [Opitutaceae bacterium]
MELVKIYECLCDLTRLRVLNVLAQGPLCVCHFQEILGEPQVKISKHLAYLRTRGLVECEREGNWMVYSLPAKPSPELKRNLACLQDCTGETPVFQKDIARLKKIAPAEAVAAVCASGGCGCESPKRRRSSIAAT